METRRDLPNSSPHLQLSCTLQFRNSDLVAPVGVPAVGDQPVRLAVLGTPAHDLDRVASEHRILEEAACLGTPEPSKCGKHMASQKMIRRLNKIAN